MPEQYEGATPSKEEWKPEPAESFEVEYLNSGKITSHLGEMGFRFSSSELEKDGVVEFEGISMNGDGTKIKIIVTKGEKYRSPKELAAEQEEK